jgi:hypothetical protein
VTALPTRAALRPRAVYLTPCVPAEAGHGLAMRAGLLLDALASRFDVHLAVAPLVDTGRPDRAEDDLWVRARVHEVETLDILRSAPCRAGPRRATHPGDTALATWTGEPRPDPWSGDGELLPLPCRRLRPGAPALVARWIADRSPALALAGRMYTAALLVGDAPRDGSPSPARVVDLDDDDAAVALQTAGLHLERGRPDLATAAFAEARRYALLGLRLLPELDGALVAGADDDKRARLRTRGGAPRHVRNAVTVPPLAATGPARTEDRILFVGSLGYLPNEDAAAWFVEHVLPLVRIWRPHTSVVIAGRSPTAAVWRLEAHPGVRVIADPPDVAPLYEEAAIAVSPVRAGGGSRTKILEAFARGVPVVTTAAGGDGLRFEAGVHALVAGEPKAMARACAELLAAPERRAAQARAAHAFVAAHHEREAAVRDAADVLAAMASASRP